MSCVGTLRQHYEGIATRNAQLKLASAKLIHGRPIFTRWPIYRRGSLVCHQTNAKKQSTGPDSYTGTFFNSCWEMIKHDLMASINSFHNSCWTNLNLLNKATIILIPKMDGAEDITDFRPISLILAIAKIITKILSLRLAPFMNQLISPCQSVFIKGRSIHDNFLYVCNLARCFHRNKWASLLMKLDISKAFNSIQRDYLLMMMQHRGFPQKWRDWITAILTTSTSRISLNGIPMNHIQHGRGLR